MNSLEDKTKSSIARKKLLMLKNRLIRVRFLRCLSALSLMGIFFLPNSAFCQKQGSDYDKDDVNAVVLNDLSFGRIVIGLTHEKNVPCTDTQAGRVIVSGLSKEEDVTLKFDLPHELRSFGHALEIDFGASSAAWSTSNDPRNATLFNPNSYFEIPSSALGSGQLYLWIGGTIILNQQQASGSYDGRILMQVQINHGSY